MPVARRFGRAARNKLFDRLHVGFVYTSAFTSVVGFCGLVWLCNNILQVRDEDLPQPKSVEVAGTTTESQ